MSRPGFADREQLKAWADTRQSQSQIPRLIRRLILETSPGVVHLGMPADEGVSAGDWDGSVRAEAASTWVPGGLSVWELSVDKSPGVKADTDYSKRMATPDGTAPNHAVYVEAILRPWTTRDSWATDRRAERRWQDVRAYGLDDLATWLESAPATWAWFSELLGLSPYGIQTGSTFWQIWSAQTDPALTPEMVLAGRDQNVGSLDEACARAGVTTISGSSLDEISGFIAARATQDDGTGQGRALARLVFVDDLSAWRRLLDSPQPLILVPRDPAFARQVPAGTMHTILAPVTGTEGDINLAPLDGAVVAGCLKTAGIGDDRRADDLGMLARRSLTALRRNLATKSALHRPPWADANSRRVRGMLLAGNWNDKSDADRAVLKLLTGTEYDSLREMAIELSDPADPFVSLSGVTWHVVSPVDAWLLLAPTLTEDDLTRFKAAADAVLGEQDPALEIAQEDRWWKASVEGKRRAHSSQLARGLAATLALLGTYGDRVKTSGGSSGSEWAEYLVRELLEPANADATGRTWASLAGPLSLLAEAAPEALLNALASATSGTDPVAKHFFNDGEETDTLTSSSTHTNVLWALETVAWSPAYFSRATDILARLDELDPGGRLSNRPAATLSNLFRPWHPDTAAPAKSRLTVFDTLRKRHPATAWKLGLALLPESHGVHFPNSDPDYRDWKPSELPVAQAEYMEFVTALVDRCTTDARNDPARWVQLLERYSNLSPSDQTLIRDRLTNQTGSNSFDDSGREQIWNQLRDLVGNHREFAEAHWSLPGEELTKLDGLIDALAPTSARARHEWLFQTWTPHLGDARRRDDFAAYDAMVVQKREEAIGEIVDAAGLDEIRDLARSVKVAHAVGWALGGARPKFDDELIADLESDQEPDFPLSVEYFARRFRESDWSWLNDFIAQHDLSAAQQGRLLLATRDFPRAWELAAANPEVADYFWKHFSPLGLGADFAHIDLVATELMAVGRNAGALHFLNIYLAGKKELVPEHLDLILQGLEGLLSAQDDKEMASLRAYDFESLFGYLERNHQKIDTERLAGLEWAYLPALGYDARVPALASQLATSPSFFIEVVCSIYRRRDGEEDDSAEADEGTRVAKASNGYRLLSAWNEPPGLEGKTMNPERLRTWTEAVEPELRARDRLEVGMQHLGQVLASSPADADGIWPGEVVRDFLEERQDDQIEKGVYLAVLNNRGVTTRSLDEGGQQERELATKFNANAAHVADTAPRTAALLRKIANSYEIDARREDDAAEHFKRGLN